MDEFPHDHHQFDDMNDVVVERRELAEINVGAVVGFVLAAFGLVFFCICCFCNPSTPTGRAIRKALSRRDLVDEDEPDNETGRVTTQKVNLLTSPGGNDVDVELGDTDSDVSEESGKSNAMASANAHEVFLRGRQAARARGLNNEPADAFAIGYVDGNDYFAQTRGSDNIQPRDIAKNAKRLGMADSSAERYVAGFQTGLRDAGSEMPSMPINLRSILSPDDANKLGTAKSKSLGMSGSKSSAYGSGYAEGYAAGLDGRDASSAQRPKLPKNENQAFESAIGIGVADGRAARKIAYRTGMDNAQLMDIRDREANAYASGFRDAQGYAHNAKKRYLETEQEPEELKEEYVVDAGKKLGFAGNDNVNYVLGFRDGINADALNRDGSFSSENFFNAGLAKARIAGLSGTSARAYATGYRDGQGHFKFQEITGPMGSLKSKVSMEQMADNAKKLGFSQEDTDHYSNGFKDGVREGSAASTQRGPSPFVVGLTKAKVNGLRSSSKSKAYASGYRDGQGHFCFQATSYANGHKKYPMTDSALEECAKNLGFENKQTGFHIQGFRDGLEDGSAVCAQQGILSPREIGSAKAHVNEKQGSMAKAFATGYSDGFVHFKDVSAQSPSSNKVSTKSIMTDRQITKRAKQRNMDVNNYVPGFHAGVKDASIASGNQGLLSPFQIGLTKAKIAGLQGNEAKAYATGFGDGQFDFQELSGKNVSSSASISSSDSGYVDMNELLNKAEKVGFSGDLAVRYANGYKDGIESGSSSDNVPQGILTPELALSVGAANAQKLGLSDSAADSYAKGYKIGNTYYHEHAASVSKLPPGSDSTISDEEMAKGAKMAGCKGEENVAMFTKGFEDAMNDARNADAQRGILVSGPAFQKGLAKGRVLGLKPPRVNAYAYGYRDGQSHVQRHSGKRDTMEISETEMMQQARGLGLDDGKNAQAYVQGFKDGMDAGSAALAGSSFISPNGAFEEGVTKSKERYFNDDNTSAFSTGYMDGYAHGLESDVDDLDLRAMAKSLGFTPQEADSYASGFKEGMVIGRDASHKSYKMGLQAANTSGAEGANASSYAAGYQEGFAHALTEKDDTKDPSNPKVSDASVGRRAQKLGYGSKDAANFKGGWRKGFMDGMLAGGSSGTNLSNDAAFSRGLAYAKSDGLNTKRQRAYAKGYQSGYDKGISGVAMPSDGDIDIEAKQGSFFGEETSSYTTGFRDGYGDGSHSLELKATRVLSPEFSMQKGIMNAEAAGHRGENGRAYATGYDVGYAHGVNRNPCNSDRDLVAKANHAGFTTDTSTKSFMNGFQDGYKDGSACSALPELSVLNEEAALKRGMKKGGKHGMKEKAANAFAQGYKDGYTAAVANKDATYLTSGDGGELTVTAGRGAGGTGGATTAAMLTKHDILEKGSSTYGYSPKQQQIYCAGYLSGLADGGAVVRHVTTCDVHRCSSAACSACQSKSPQFIFLQGDNKVNRNLKSGWWNKTDDKDGDDAYCQPVGGDIV